MALKITTSESGNSLTQLLSVNTNTLHQALQFYKYYQLKLKSIHQLLSL